MGRWRQVCAVALLAALGLFGCGRKEVVTEEDPEGMRLKQQMIEQFTQRQQQSPQQALPETTAPEGGQP